MNFADALKVESTHTYTENGAEALNTTSNACLDLFGCIGSLRERPVVEVERLFAEAYAEDKLLATKILFYARDIREGCGERKIFRDLLKYAAKYHLEAILNNLDLIGIYGRFDDLYCLIDTPVESEMWTAMKNQFEEDRKNLAEGKAISLLAKWIKTPDASSEATRKLGILTAKKLGYSVYEFKRILRAMRKHLKIVERYMSAGEWDKIVYPEVPSRAMMIYRKAFNRHDEDRFSAFMTKALTGEVKVNSSTLYPYDIVEQMILSSSDTKNPDYAWSYALWHMSADDVQPEDDLLEAQWKQLPNYVEPGTNAMIIADVSGSMEGRPMSTSVGLAIYFAERNTGAYHNLFMTFSESPKVIELKGETLKQKIFNVAHSEWGGNTNLKAAFDRVLTIAKMNHIPPEEMVKSIIVVSDMEIDSCVWNVEDYRGWTFYDNMAAEYQKAGYTIPNIVFWNVNSRHDIFHADANRKGVQLVSGSSTTMFKQLVDSIGLTPVEMMLKVINSERYEAITISE